MHGFDKGVIIALTAVGAVLAQRIAAVTKDYQVHGLRQRCEGLSVTFDNVANHLRQQFCNGHPIIAVCATGVVIRSLALVLKDKRHEPPVVCVSEDGKAVIPLLGNHHGANHLAKHIASVLDTQAALTTASECRFQLALDAPPPGYTLANQQHYKPFISALLANPLVALKGAAAPFLQTAPLRFDDRSPLSISVTEKTILGDDKHLIYHPQSLALGVGCERGTSAVELADLVQQSLDTQQLAAAAVALIVTLDRKLDEEAIEALAAQLQRPLRGYSAAQLEALTPRLQHPSKVVFNAVGCHGVAEAAALLAAGREARLVVAKQRSARATCAVAQAAPHLLPALIDVKRCGDVARGQLAIVGIGPGAAHYRTFDAITAINQAQHVVGYSLYLDLINDLLVAQKQHRHHLGEEWQRVAKAITLASSGQRVALVCSGDPGIYAMASLVFEQLEHHSEAVSQHIAVTVHPGISALQIASARVGGFIGHDFCAISLSDHLTSWGIIERRLRLALDADFVIGLYNPSSRIRRELFALALALIRCQRSAATVVVVARQLGRDAEEHAVIRLSEIDPERIDMLTMVLIGNHQTRTFNHASRARAYTPRGYAREPTPSIDHNWSEP